MTESVVADSQSTARFIFPILSNRRKQFENIHIPLFTEIRETMACLWLRLAHMNNMFTHIPALGVSVDLVSTPTITNRIHSLTHLIILWQPARPKARFRNRLKPGPGYKGLEFSRQHAKSCPDFCFTVSRFSDTNMSELLTHAKKIQHRCNAVLHLPSHDSVDTHATKSVKQPPKSRIFLNPSPLAHAMGETADAVDDLSGVISV